MPSGNFYKYDYGKRHDRIVKNCNWKWLKNISEKFIIIQINFDDYEFIRLDVRDGVELITDNFGDNLISLEYHILEVDMIKFYIVKGFFLVYDIISLWLIP